MQLTITGYSGDTPVEDGAKWANTPILIHEATFLGHGEGVRTRDYGNKHSTLDEVMEMLASIRVGSLILGHFSSRYSPEEIDRSIKDRCEKYAISFPVYRILPGETVFDILGGMPLNR